MTHCRNEWFTDDCANPRIGIKFLMNDLQHDFFTKSKDVFRKWKPLQCKFCVQTNFHSKYKSLGKQGEGKFASVYKGKSQENNIKIAIKQFSKNEYKKTSEMTILMGEINTLRAINHPNLQTLYEVQETKHSIYLVTDLMDGGDLFDCIKAKEKFQLSEASIVIQQLLCALQTC